MEETLKRERRAFYLARRNALSSAERAELSGRLCEIVAQQVVAPLESGSVEPLVVCVYGAFRSETDPSALERWCRERGHLAIAPRILSEGDSGRGDAGMELRIVGSPADWTTGRWNVPEPNPETARPYPADGRIDVVLVPGLAFDENGGRLGYGGGYYDRFYAARRALSLAALGRTLWIGFAYEAQLSEEALPREPHDLPLDGVATELGLRRLNGGMAVESQQKQETGAPDRLTHFNEQGRAAMVDVTDKAVTSRTAVAETRVRMRPETLSRIRERSVAKGDVLAVAQIAGIQAAKRTSDWIPMCHPLPLTGVDIRFEDNGSDTLYIAAEVKTTGKTGVEMEALTAVSAAALTVYDMCKAVQKDMEIGPTRLLSKTGGKSGDYAAPET